MTDGLIEENEAFPDTVGSTPDWFKSAVFYEVLVRSFRDSNGVAAVSGVSGSGEL